MNVSQLAQCPVLPLGDLDYHIAQTLSFSYISFWLSYFSSNFFLGGGHSMLYLNQSTADLYLTSSLATNKDMSVDFDQVITYCTGSVTR